MNKYYTDKFKGTAQYYTKYRPHYPDEFFTYLMKIFKLDKSKRILDLGCGPGTIAIPLSKYCKEVIAIDPEPEMLQAAKKIASSTKRNNITWIQGSSHDLEENRNIIKNINLVTMGTSFHWMDGSNTLNILKQYINEGGGICIVYNQSIWDHPNEWQIILKETVQKYLGRNRKAGSNLYKKHPESIDESIKNAHLQNIQTKKFTYTIKRNIENIIGLTYSMSFASEHALGPHKKDFEVELRQKLLELNQSGQFQEEIITTSFIAFK